MTKLLNLDELASTSEKRIKLAGREHVAAELTVQAYIDRVNRAKKVEEATDEPGSNIERAMELVMEVFPSISRDNLGGLSLSKLQVLIEYALAAPEDIEQQANASAPDGATPQGNA